MIITETIEYINLPAKDIEESIQFYSELFDFEVLENNKELEFAILSYNSIKIRIIKKKEEAINQFPILSLLVDIDDFSEAIDIIENKEIHIIKGPDNTEDNGEFIHVADPSNNLIEIFYKN